MSELPTIVVGVPGKWADRSAILESIVKHSGGYLFAGMLLMHIETKWSCSLEIYENDPNLRRAFEIAGGGRFSAAQLDEIDEHTFTLYLSCDGGSPENARALMNAVTAILNCGGAGVKIESTGIAHTPERWRELDASELPVALMDAFVTYVGGDGGFYSCGMQNIGFRDAVVNSGVSPNDAANLLFTLNAYIALENATIGDGETFSVDATSPRYRVNKKQCDMFATDDLFHNPYGIHDLTPA